MTRLRLLIATLAFALASNAWGDLRTYEVDAQYRQEIYSALKEILTPQGQPTQGRVELLPSGQLLVNAGTETLDQVEQVLQAIRNRPAAAAPRAELRYWAVLGNRGTSNTPGTATPRVLDDVLAELERLHGELTFRVIGTAAIATDSGQPGNISGMALEVAQTAYVQGDTLNAFIGINLEGAPTGDPPQPLRIGDLRVRTTLRRGEFLVLGESELKSGGVDGPVFFIVHWPEK